MGIVSGRLFAEHYQFVICDRLDAEFGEAENWTDEAHLRGYAGSEHFRMIGTCADGNDHWFVASVAERAPDPDDWHRVTCAPAASSTGVFHILSIIDDAPVMSLRVEPGEYAIYAACNNPGVDQYMLGDQSDLDDEALSARKDLEWYHVFVVPGTPPATGVLKDTG